MLSTRRVQRHEGAGKRQKPGERPTFLSADDPVGGGGTSIHTENLVPIRVLIVHYYRSILWGLERLVESATPPMQVAAGVATVAEALACLATVNPDVIILDMNINKDAGLDVIPRLIARSEAKILMLAGGQDTNLYEAAILKGARGVVGKGAEPETILNAIRKVHAGELWLDHVAVGHVVVELARRLAGQTANPELPKISLLTAREREAVAFAASHPGATAREIAEKLHISEHTMRNHLNSIYEKLGVSNRVELYVYAHKHGLSEAGGQ